ncbi:MAG: hypothetical protein AAF349_09425 [Cyanobacteria bacterium P01_A01_bin.68]
MRSWREVGGEIVDGESVGGESVGGESVGGVGFRPIKLMNP